MHVFYVRVCLPQATTCPRSSGATAAIWTRRPSPTDRWLSTLAGSRKGTVSHFSRHRPAAWLFQHYYRRQHAPLLLALHIHQNKTHPTGVRSWVGWTQQPSSPALGQVHGLTACTECRDEYRVGYYSCTEWTALFSWQTQGPSGYISWQWKWKCRNQRRWWILYVWQVQTGVVCVGRKTVSEYFCLRSAT